MARLRLLIVDDEPLARERLRALLRTEPETEIAGECTNGTEALAAIRRDRPDVVLLDVQMPGCDGLQVVEELSPEDRPAIVFVTAHERYAVDAFARHAVDYLLKPFDRARLQQALQRARDVIQNRRAGNLDARLENLLALARNRAPERLAFKVDGRVVFLQPDDIVWIEAANNYSILHLADTKRLMLREALSALAQRLGPRFTRVNRSAMVRTEQVQELQPANYGDYVVVLRNGTRLPLSRDLRGRFEKFGSPEG
ncbi:MAG TPA: LytTR family DNA-binding domain-containing protein [Opitutus sp.]|nr:LytTR family DNA-binding domain-containing protein [Opitutus sp.]